MSDLEPDIVVESAPEVRRPLIKTIHVERLFGEYTYPLKLNATQNTTEPRLLVLYGDNGSGKTTVLRLLFATLSPKKNSKQLNLIARTPFERFEVQTESGLSIAIVRSSESIVGSFRIEAKQESHLLAAVDFKADENFEVSKLPSPDENREKLSEILTSLKIEFHYLADDRQLIRSGDSGDTEETEEVIIHRFDGSFRYKEHVSRNSTRSIDNVLKGAMQNLTSWVRQQTLRASDSGNTAANIIYADVVRSIANYGINEAPVANDGFDITEEMGKFSERNEQFHKFGLSSKFTGGELERSILTANPANYPLLQRILKPYLDGLSARLDALDGLKDALTVFSDSINSLYGNKEVRFHVRRGLTIHSKGDGTLIYPHQLSSGERQLLLLLCNAITARDKASIFIIDEPEISLNVKWQRKIISILLACLKGSDSQFIIATHSIELLTQYRKNVCSLTDLSKSQQ